jgi:hypothetical protein
MGKQDRNALTAVDGFILGVDMIREMRAIAEEYAPEAEPCAIEQQYRKPGTPQRNIVAEYLERIDAMANGELRRGFAAFLTEYLKSCSDGGVPDLEIYEEISETEAI